MDLIPLPISVDKKKEIVEYLCDKFDYAVRARMQQVDGKYTRWMKNYAGEPKERTRSTPWPNASNFVPQLIRMHTDILSARVSGFVFGTKPFWNPKIYLPSLKATIPHEILKGLADWFDHESFFNIKLYQPLDSAFMRAFKTGTATCKVPWVKEEVMLGQMGTATAQFKAVPLLTEGLRVQPVPFDDFYPYPLTAESIDQVRIKFHKLRLSPEDVKRRAAQGIWDKKACDLLLQTEEQPNEPARQAAAQEAGIALDQYTSDQIKCVEAWFDYPIENDVTKMYRVVVVFNPKDKTETGYLRGYFIPSTKGIEPFFSLTPMPREDLYYGYSQPEILESAQEEMSQIHNFRRDANTIANSPGWKKKKDADVPNPSTSWYPGKVFEVDDMADLEPIQFGGSYNSLIDEEQFLIGWVERLTGSGPPTQGLGAGGMEGKRGIYTAQGTLAMLSEGNRRLDVLTKRCRNSYHRLGSIIYHSNRDFGNVSIPTEFLQFADIPNIFFDIGASDASANKEVERGSLLQMANTMATYQRQIVEIVQIIATIPPDNPIREVMLVTLDGARDLADRLLAAFDIGDRERVLPNIRDTLNGGQPGGPGQPGAPNPNGLPEAEAPLSVGGVQDLQALIANFANQNAGGPGTLQ